MKIFCLKFRVLIGIYEQNYLYSQLNSSNIRSLGESILIIEAELYPKDDKCDAVIEDAEDTFMFIGTHV